MEVRWYRQKYSGVKTAAWQFDSQTPESWPAWFRPWAEEDAQPRDMSWGYVLLKEAMTHVGHGDYVLVSRMPGKDWEPWGVMDAEKFASLYEEDFWPYSQPTIEKLEPGSVKAYPPGVTLEHPKLDRDYDVPAFGKVTGVRLGEDERSLVIYCEFSEAAKKLGLKDGEYKAR